MAPQDIVLKDIPPRTMAYLRCRGSWRQLPEMLAKLTEYVSKRGVQPTGPASGIYYNTPNEVSVQDLEWDVLYPVETDTPESVENKEFFGIRKLSVNRVASIVHEGSYRQTGSSYERLEVWIKHQRFVANGPAEEVYLPSLAIPSKEQTIEIRLPISFA
ncbi:GyrI-like domain-containing protein [Chloroflexota bacterium]